MTQDCRRRPAMLLGPGHHVFLGNHSSHCVSLYGATDRRSRPTPSVCNEADSRDPCTKYHIFSKLPTEVWLLILAWAGLRSSAVAASCCSSFRALHRTITATPEYLTRALLADYGPSGAPAHIYINPSQHAVRHAVSTDHAVTTAIQELLLLSGSTHAATALSTVTSLSESLLPSIFNSNANSNLVFKASIAASRTIFRPHACNLLQAAAAAGHLRVVAAALCLGARPHEGALVAASRFGRCPVIQLLLAAGADPDAAEPFGPCALLEASRNGHHEAVQLLLDAGAKVEGVDASSTPRVGRAGGGSGGSHQAAAAPQQLLPLPSTPAAGAGPLQQQQQQPATHQHHLPPSPFIWPWTDFGSVSVGGSAAAAAAAGGAGELGGRSEGAGTSSMTEVGLSNAARDIPQQQHRRRRSSITDLYGGFSGSFPSGFFSQGGAGGNYPGSTGAFAQQVPAASALSLPMSQLNSAATLLGMSPSAGGVKDEPVPCSPAHSRPLPSTLRTLGTPVASDPRVMWRQQPQQLMSPAISAASTPATRGAAGPPRQLPLLPPLPSLSVPLPPLLLPPPPLLLSRRGQPANRQRRASLSASATTTTPLMAACAAGHATTVATLVKRGAQIDVTHGSELLVAAHPRVVESLLSAAPSLSAHLGTALVAAAGANRPDVVSELLRHGADPMFDNCMALSEAAYQGHRTIAELLLQAAGPRLRNSSALTAAAVLARRWGRTEVAALLESFA
ncbi:hypothetical protein Agub_g13054 [Astrephomene gubernaculifera]|uniref:Uncharacterized protein n=1 Tax=Astrephomene gubernaculifera TaxID=47775 RepID=A0AAD3DZB3_9CHLO|nr:hypothetical protein Agub_g13054 [Astrephomene gubernaculifera]